MSLVMFTPALLPKGKTPLQPLGKNTSSGWHSSSNTAMASHGSLSGRPATRHGKD